MQQDTYIMKTDSLQNKVSIPTMECLNLKTEQSI